MLAILLIIILQKYAWKWQRKYDFKYNKFPTKRMNKLHPLESNIIWMYFFIDGWNSFINQFNCELQHVNKKNWKRFTPALIHWWKIFAARFWKNSVFHFLQVIKNVLYSIFPIVSRIDSHRLDLISDHEPFFWFSLSKIWLNCNFIIFFT